MAQEFVRSRKLLDREGPMGDLTRRERAKWKRALEATADDPAWMTLGNDDVKIHDGFGVARAEAIAEDAQLLDELTVILDKAVHPDPLPAPQEVVRQANKENQWARVRNMFKVNRWPERMRRSYAQLSKAAHGHGDRECVRAALLEQDAWVSFFVLWLLFLILICLVRYTAF